MSVRLLLDENLAERLVPVLAGACPGSRHVAAALGASARDEAIWEHARRQGFVIVTKDEDFQRLSVWRGAPPKVIWVRLGNCSTADVAALLHRSRDLVHRFVAHEDVMFLAVG